SPLVPRALLASASDLAAIGNLGDAATLLERYAAGYQRQLAIARDRRAHSRGSRPSESAVYEESKAQVALHDAAVLREARGELRQAVADRALGLQLWKSPADPDEQRYALAQLRARVDEPARVARDMADLARSVKQKPALQIAAWREAARLFAKAGEASNAQWSWTELERVYRALGPKGREKLPLDALAAAADAHFELGAGAFESFRKQEIRPPLMATLNRKIALLHAVKRRAEEPGALRVATLLDKMSVKPAERVQLSVAASPVVDIPELVDARTVAGERPKRLMSETVAAAARATPPQAVEKFQALVQALHLPAAQFDLAVALDRAGRGIEAEEAYRAAASEKGALGYEAGARAGALAAARGDAKAARDAVVAATTALASEPAARLLQARIELALGNADGALAAVRSVLAVAPTASSALCTMARAQLSVGQSGTAKLFASRAALADPLDPEALLVQAEIARVTGEPAAELAALQAAVELDPAWSRAQVALGRALYERGQQDAALNALEDAADLDPSSYAAALSYGQALARETQHQAAKEALHR